MKTIRKSTIWNKQTLPLAAALVFSGVGAAYATDYPTTILADHPVAYYRLEEANGSATVADSSTNGNTGFVNYVTQADNVTVFPQLGVAGLDTNSAFFGTSTGTGQGSIQVPVNSTMNPTTDGTNGAPFSAELWVMATTLTGNFEVPLDDSSDFGQPPPFNNSAGWNFYQTAAPGSTWSFSIRPNPGFVGSGTNAVVVGQWTYLVLTYDGTNASFFVNGTPQGTFPVPQFLANNGAENMVMGSGPATGFSPFDGRLDEVALYNYPLSLSQITNHFAIGTSAIAPEHVAPTFSSQPADASVYAGVPVTFTSQALGTAPLSYQWVRGGTGAILGATNNNYTFTPSFPADNNATFSVTVTNLYGHTNSTTATLTVLTNLNMVNDPFSITRRVGGYAAFRVVANGALPISYQWHYISNAVDHTIAGATSDTLWLSNVQATASGTLYFAHVTGPFGVADSGQATLTVVPRTATAPVSGYSKVVMADSPVAYWRLDETNGSTNALDTVGSFDGAYSSVGTDLTFGYPSGIPHEIDTAIHVTNTAIMTVPYALELNPVTGPWSVEFWIQPTSLDGANFHTPISSEYNNLAGTVTGWNVYQHPAGVWTWNLFNGGLPGSFSSEFTDTIAPGTWYHMVLEDDGTNLVWYSNNRLVLSTTVAAIGFIPNGINGDPTVAGGPLTLAIRSDGVFGDWDGGIDDVAVYNYVLSPSQIQNHFLNTTHLTITSSGANTVVTWPAGTLQSSTNVTGTYTNVPGATSPFTNSTAGPQLYYRVQLQ